MPLDAVCLQAVVNELTPQLTGARIEKIQQPARDLGAQSRVSLILAALGRHANLFLCEQEGRILDCLRRVDLEMSQERQVLPGLYYHLPPRQQKRDPLTVTREEFTALLPRGEEPLDGWLLSQFTAMPPLIAREIVSRA